jgi:peptidoglycan/xylan/chitin deacetylase (PgdA/CDA1 family)
MSKQLKKLSIIAFVVILILSVGYSVFNRVTYIPAVLMYHSVVSGQAENNLSVSTFAFDRQMNFLKKHHYRVVFIKQLAAMIREKRKIPHNTVAITFDDGWKDNYTNAYPILKKYELPANIFLTINEIGRPDRVSWDEVSIMLGSGLIDFGSHTLDHLYLKDVKSDSELKRQIFGSKKVLEQKIQRPVEGFCYPIGAFTPRIRQLVIDAGYKFATTVSPGKKYADQDLFALKRVKITEKSNNMFIFWAKVSGHYVYLKEHLTSKKKDYGY